MRILALLLTLSIIASCKKDEANPAVQYRFEWPAATCNDTTDDGRYQLWDSTLVYHASVSNTPEVSDVVDTIYVGKRLVNDSTAFLPFRIFAETTIPSTLGVFLVADTNSTHGWGSGSLGTSHNIDLSTKVFPNGCYRYFYLMKDESGRVLTKGHFDVEVAW